MSEVDVVEAEVVQTATVRTDGQDALRASERVALSASTSAAAAQAGADGLDPNHPARATDVVIVDADAGIVTSTRKKIAICGFASSSRYLIPVNDPEWEIWGLNQLYRHITRADRWFDIHHNWDTDIVAGTDHREWARHCGIPFYMMTRQPDVPTAVRYPIERLIAEYQDYFTSTIAFMMAVAIDEIRQRVDVRVAAGELTARMREKNMTVVQALRDLHAEYQIGIFGVDLVVGEEYDWQKACAEFWIGVASIGLGITVVLPPATALCKQMYRYGYESEPNTLVKLSEVKGHADKLMKERVELINRLHMVDGAIAADDYWQQLITLRLRGAEVSAV